jgi:hypothetical protein
MVGRKVRRRFATGHWRALQEANVCILAVRHAVPVTGASLLPRPTLHRPSLSLALPLSLSLTARHTFSRVQNSCYNKRAVVCNLCWCSRRRLLRCGGIYIFIHGG